MHAFRFPRSIPLALSLVACTAVSAAPAYMKLGDIKGECAQSEHALLQIKTTQPQPVALLLPAVQKVREAAARMQTACKGAANSDTCNASQLSALVLQSDDGRDPALSLLDLYARGSGLRLKDAQTAVRKAGASTDASAAKGLLDSLLIGLLKEMQAARVPAAVSDPIQAALDASPGAAPPRVSSPDGKVGG